MCGIFSVVLDPNKFNPDQIKQLVNTLHLLSESRGKESSGLAFVTNDTIEFYKGPIPANTLIKKNDFREWFDGYLNHETNKTNGAHRITIIGHSRLVTDGQKEHHDNNQPVIAGRMVGIHNGIVVNSNQLWKENPGLQRHFEVDTEVLFSLIRQYYDQDNSLTAAFQMSYKAIKGTANIIALFEDINVLVAATNNGSLYSIQHENNYIFASERFILEELMKTGNFAESFANAPVKRVNPGEGIIVDINSGNSMPFSLTHEIKDPNWIEKKTPSRVIIDKSNQKIYQPVQSPKILSTSTLKQFDIDERPIRALKRCTRCVLPETMPFIEFDEQGVCNYCHSHVPIIPLGEDALFKAVEPFRNSGRDSDCLLTFSGGRDSSYGAHYIRTVLKMTPMTYTYDWGMITDLGRRNQARMCGQLELENILVSADIPLKRRYIRKNVLAWLKKPDLGLIPLFMAGDKQYFYHANVLSKQTKNELVFICINPFERTNFKTGFCGVKPPFASKSNYALSFYNQIKMALYYGKNYIANPAYLNESVFDTLGAFYSFYSIQHNYIDLFHYLPWEEKVINSTLIETYDWETANDTKATWRIGDGTASFYNYIYYILAGFTENDTFRSNQIREGKITRAEALEKIYTENQPRFESIQWYCDTIGLDMQETLKTIRNAQKLY